MKKLLKKLSLIFGVSLLLTTQVFAQTNIDLSNGKQDVFGLTRTYEAESTIMGHQVGYSVGNAWCADVYSGQGFMLYGPYVADLNPGSRYQVEFILKVDNNSADGAYVGKIEVSDYDANQKRLAELHIKRTWFQYPNNYQSFNIEFIYPAAGHRMEFRLWHFAISQLTVDKIILRQM